MFFLKTRQEGKISTYERPIFNAVQIVRSFERKIVIKGEFFSLRSSFFTVKRLNNAMQQPTAFVTAQPVAVLTAQTGMINPFQQYHNEWSSGLCDCCDDMSTCEFSNKKKKKVEKFPLIKVVTRISVGTFFSVHSQKKSMSRLTQSAGDFWPLIG